MAELWYYTSEGKQMDPVSMKELRRLVSDGVLKPTDMVWKEGMARWIRASSVKELYPDPAAALDHFFSHTQNTSRNGENQVAATAPVGAADAGSIATRAATGAPSMPPVAQDESPTRKRRPASAADDDDRPSRRVPMSGGGSNLGIIIAFLLGGGVLVVALVGGAIILIVVTRPDPAPPIPPPLVELKKNPLKPINPANLVQEPRSYNVNFDKPNSFDNKNLSFRKGSTYNIAVTTKPPVNMEVSIFDSNNELMEKVVGLFGTKDWSPPEDGEYRIESRNPDPFMRTVLTISLRDVNFGGPVKKEPDLPADVKSGSKVMSGISVPPGKDLIFKLRVKGGYKATIAVTNQTKRPNVDFNIHILREGNDEEITSDTRMDANANVDFTLKADEIVRVRVVNASKGGPPARCTIAYDGGN